MANTTTSYLDMAYNWFAKRKPEFVKLESRTRSKHNKVFNCTIRLLRECVNYLNDNMDRGHNIALENDSNDYLDPLLWVGIERYMNINFIDNTDSDDRIYVLQFLLILNGFEPEITGIYGKSTRNSVQLLKSHIKPGVLHSCTMNSMDWYNIIKRAKEGK